MSADFLLEFLSEEIPARMQARARGDLARMFAEALAAAGLRHEGITTYSTPRRLALIAKALPDATEAVSDEIKGPKTAAPQQALDGFLRKTGLAQDQLEDRDGTWFAAIDRPGRATVEVLQQRLPSIILQFPWPKSMRWGADSKSTESLRWIRPLHNVLAILGNEHIEIDLSSFGLVRKDNSGEVIVTKEFTPVTSLQATLGHRFHHPGPITIGGAHDYVEKLRACHVLVDHAERETIIRNGAKAAAEGAGFSLVEDEGLVVENAGLTEWPVSLLGSFDPDYLDVPEEVIQLTARTNQKYFVMRGEQRSHAGGMASSGAAGKLAPHFVCTANIDANDGGAAIIAGNERVLAARLSDARFFWQQDLKVPLDEQAKKLEQIVFHEKLGTVADKVERVAKLAEWLVTEGIVKGCSAADAKRAAELCKADLVTGMVGEFPELQGVIGGYLARAQGEDAAVADAIRDHYKPVGQGDDVPTAPLTVAVSLADKLDTLSAFFSQQMFPTGSKDPFALRRSALGVISLIRQNLLSVEIGEVVRQGWSGSGPSSLSDTLIDFLIERLKVALKEEGGRHDLVSASTDWMGKFDGRLDRVERRSKALQAFVETGEGANLLAGFKRATNILKKEGWSSAPAEAGALADIGQDSPTLRPSPEHSAPGHQLEPAESAFIAALDAAGLTATAAIEIEDFTGAMSALASLRAPIDAFFEKVTVNADDAGVRARRLNLLARFRDAVNRVADFSKIEG